MIGIGPVTERAQAQHGNGAAQQRPTRRQPCLQHPTQGRAHQRAHDQQPDPGISQNYLAGRKQQSLPRKIHRLIRRLHGDVDAFKVRPHRGCRIREAPVRKGVASQEKTEVVGNERQWHRKERQNRQAQDDHAQSYACNHKPLSLRQPCKQPLHASKTPAAQPRKREGQRHCHCGHAAFKNQQRRVGLMGGGQQHFGPVPSLRIGAKLAGDHRDSTASTCAREPRIQLPEPLSSPWNHACICSEIHPWRTTPPKFLRGAEKDGSRMLYFVAESITQKRLDGCGESAHIQPLLK